MSTRRRFLACGLGCAATLSLPRWASLAAASDPAAADVERWTRTVCDLCGLGEPVFLRTADATLRAVKGIPLSASGFGRLCPRARALVEASASADRAVGPLLRKDPSTKGSLDGLEPASWDEALAATLDGLAAARAAGGGPGVAVLASDAETCETYAALARLARVSLGTDHLDTPARLDALPAYDACRDILGVAANPSALSDVDAAAVLVLVGGDLADSHPGLFVRALDSRRAGRSRVLLIDSRRTLAAGIADVHLRPAPGREIDAVRAFAAALAGRPGADAGLAELARRAREGRGVVTLVGPMALGTYAGPALAHAVAAMHAETGQLGGNGRGFLLLPRGANATGVVVLGVAPGRLPAGRRLESPEDRAAIAAAWGVAADALPASRGLALPAWPRAIAEGGLRALLVLRANPAAELPDALAWRTALASAFTVAAVTHVPTETTCFADVVLPLGLVAGESSGTMMALDRRCQRLEVAIPPPGEAVDAETLIARLAAALPGSGAPERAPGTTSWDALAPLTAGTPYDLTGIPTDRLRKELDVTWPCASADRPGTARLAAAPAGVPSRRPDAAPHGPVPAADAPLLLLAGPVREHSGSRVRTGRTAELHYEAPSARLEMHPSDASAAGLADGEWVTVTSATGEATARLWITDRVAEGTVFLPEHYGSVSDLQGGSDTQGEPEGLAARVIPNTTAPDGETATGLPAAVSVRQARRRDLRQRGMRRRDG